MPMINKIGDRSEMPASQGDKQGKHLRNAQHVVNMGQESLQANKAMEAYLSVLCREKSHAVFDHFDSTTPLRPALFWDSGHKKDFGAPGAGGVTAGS